MRNLAKWKCDKYGMINIHIVGKCMEPLIKHGDVITISKLSCDPQLGDIVLVYTDNLLKVHRIVYIDNSIVLTKGDNVDCFDRNTDIKNIIGLYHCNELDRIIKTKNSYEIGLKQLCTKGV